MKLYYAPGTCSLSPHIVAREAGIPIELIKVDIRSTPHVTEHGDDYTAINPKGYVPLLATDDGTHLTEGVAIVQFLADRAPHSRLAPPPGTPERYKLQEWLTFISAELHKMFSPWLFHPEHGELAQQVARQNIARQFALLERHLESQPYLLGQRFTVADAYCFTVASWSHRLRIDLSPYPSLRDYLQRIAQRPKVREALETESLLPAAS